MKRHFRIIWDEIRQGQNIEVYVVLLLCVVFLFFSLFRPPTEREIASGILAILVLLAVGHLRLGRTAGDLRHSLSRLDIDHSSDTFFAEWDDSRFRERLRTGREIWQQAVSSYQFMNANEAFISRLMIRGGRYRCILVDPEGAAVTMAARRHAGAASEVLYISQQHDLARLKLKEFAGTASPGAVRLKIIDHLVEPIMTVIDPHEEDGLMFVTLGGFQTPMTARPSFVLHKTRDARWFAFYLRSFEKLWKSQEAEEIDLS